MDGAEKQHRLAKILILIFLYNFYGERNQIVTAVDFTIKVKHGLQSGKGNSSGSELQQSEQMLDSSKNMYETRQDYNEKIQLLNTPFSSRDKKDHEMIITSKVIDEPTSNADDKLNDNELDEIKNKDEATDKTRSFNVIKRSLSKNNIARDNLFPKQITIIENKRKQKRCARNKVNNSILKQKPIKLAERLMAAPVTPSCCQSLSRIYAETLNLKKHCKCSDSVNTIQPTENDQLAERIINNNLVKMPNNQNNDDVNNFFEYNNQVKNMISELKTSEKEYKAIMTDNYYDKYDTKNKFSNLKSLTDRQFTENLINNQKTNDEKKFYPHSFQDIEIYKKFSNDETNNKEINWQENKLLDDLNLRIRGTPKDSNNNSLIKVSDDESSSSESTPITFDDNAIMETNIPFHYDSMEKSSDKKLQLNEVGTLQEPIKRTFLPKINEIELEKKKEIIEVTTFKAMLNDKQKIFMESNKKQITEEESTRRGIILLDENPQSAENDSKESEEGIKPDLLERTNLNELDNVVSSTEHSSDTQNKLESYSRLNDELSQNNEKTNLISNNYSSIKNTENNNSLIRSDEKSGMYYHDNEKTSINDNDQFNQSPINSESITEKEDSNYNGLKTSKPLDEIFKITLNDIDKNVTLKNNPPVITSEDQINSKSIINSNNISDKISSKSQVETLEDTSLVSSVEYKTIPITISTAKNDYNGAIINKITEVPIYWSEGVEGKISSIEQEHSTKRNIENLKNILPSTEPNKASGNHMVSEMNKNDAHEIDNKFNEEKLRNNPDIFLKTETDEPQENTTLEPYFTKYNNQISNLINQGGDKLQKTIKNPDHTTLKYDNINSITTENIMYMTPPISRGIPDANDIKEIENVSKHQTSVKFYNTATTEKLEEKVLQDSVETTSLNNNLNDIKSLNDKESQLQRTDLVNNSLNGSNQGNNLQEKYYDSKQNHIYRQYSSTFYPYSKESEKGSSTVLNTNEIIEHNNTENNLSAEVNEKTMQNEKSEKRLQKDQQSGLTETNSVTETIADKSLPSSYHTHWGTRSTENSINFDLKRANPTTEMSLIYTKTENEETSKLNDRTNKNILSRTEGNENDYNKLTATEHYQFQPVYYEKFHFGGAFPDIETTSKSNKEISANINPENEENSGATVVTQHKTSAHDLESDNNTIKDNSKIITSGENFEVNNEKEPKTIILITEPKELIEEEFNYSSDNYPSTYNYETNIQESVNTTENVIKLQRKDSEITTEMSKPLIDATQNTNDILQKTESSSLRYQKISDDSINLTTATSQIPDIAGYISTDNARNNIHENTIPYKNLDAENHTMDDNEELQVSKNGLQKELSQKNQLLEFTNSGSMQTTLPNYDSLKVKDYDNKLETTNNNSAVTELMLHTTSLKDADYTAALDETSSTENNVSKKLDPFENDKEDTSKTHTPKEIEFTHDTSVTADQFEKITDSKATNYSTSNNISNVLDDTAILHSGNYKDSNNDAENSLLSIKNKTDKVSEDSQNDTSGNKASSVDENNFMTDSLEENLKNVTTKEPIGNQIYSENSSTETEMKDKFSKDIENGTTLQRVLPPDEKKLDPDFHKVPELNGDVTSDELIKIQLPSENRVDSTIPTKIKKVSEESESIFSLTPIPIEGSTRIQLPSKNTSVSKVVPAEKFSDDKESNITQPRILPSDESKEDSSSERNEYDTSHSNGYDNSYGNGFGTLHQSKGIQQPSENQFDSTKTKIFSEESKNNTSIPRVLPSDEKEKNYKGNENGISNESVGIQPYSENSSDPTETAMTNEFSKDLENSTSLPRLLESKEIPNVITETNGNKYLNEPTDMGIQVSDNPLDSTTTLKKETPSKKLQNNIPPPRIFSVDADNNHSKINLPTRPKADQPLHIQIPYEEINNVFDINEDYEVSDGNSKTEKVPEIVEQRRATDNTYENIYTADENTLDDTLNKFQETHILSTSTISYFDNENKNSDQIINSKSYSIKNKDENFSNKRDNEKLNISKDFDNYLFIQKSTEKNNLIGENAEKEGKQLLFDSFSTEDEKNEPTPGKQKPELHSLTTTAITVTESEIDTRIGNNEQNNSSENYTPTRLYPLTFTKMEMYPRVEELPQTEKVSDSNHLKETTIELTSMEDTKAIKINESELNGKNSKNDMNSTTQNYEPTLSHQLTFTNTEVNPKVEVLPPESVSDFDYLKQKLKELTTTEETKTIKTNESELKSRNSYNNIESTTESYEPTWSYTFRNTQANPEVEDLHQEIASDSDYLKEEIKELTTTEGTKAIQINESELKSRNRNNNIESTTENYEPTWSYTLKNTQVNPEVEKLHQEKAYDSDYLKEEIKELTTTEDTKAIQINESELKSINSNNKIESITENYEPTSFYHFRNAQVNPEVEVLNLEKVSDSAYLKEKPTELTTDVTTVIKITESKIQAKNDTNDDTKNSAENYESTKPMRFKNTEVNSELKEKLDTEEGSDFDFLKEQNESTIELSELNEREFTTNITPLKNDNLNLTSNKENYLKKYLPTITPMPLYLQDKSISNENIANKFNLLQSPEEDFDQTPSHNIITSNLHGKGILGDLKEGIPVILSLPVLIVVKNASLLDSPQSKYFIENNGEKIEIDVRKSNRPSEISITPYQTDLEDDDKQHKRLGRQNIIEGNSKKRNEKNLSKSKNYYDNKNLKTLMNNNKIDLRKENNLPFKTSEEKTKEKKYPLLEVLLSPQIKRSMNDKLKMMFDTKQHTKSEHDDITPDSNIIDVVYTSLKRLKKLFSEDQK